MRQRIPDEYAAPVRIVKTTEELTNLGVEFGAWSTVTVPQIGTNTGTLAPILARRPSRLEARIMIPPQSAGATSIVLAHRQDYVSNPANPQGGIIPAPAAGGNPFSITYKSQQPVFAVGIGGPATIIVLDEAQAVAQATAEEDVEYIPEEWQTEGTGGLDTGP